MELMGSVIRIARRFLPKGVKRRKAVPSMNKQNYSDETSFRDSTCTIITWIPAFQQDKYLQIIIDSLKYCQESKG